ncbi:AsmA protein / A/G-specific adenine glycosylase [Chelatococcus asaccharovorans]|nr:AsmA protein / A/G-specific adenine glycosylase [Chelatococcus asaccharovorans]
MLLRAVRALQNLDAAEEDTDNKQDESDKERLEAVAGEERNRKNAVCHEYRNDCQYERNTKHNL